MGRRSSVAVQATADGEAHFIAVNYDGSGRRDLGKGREPTWTADGQEIIFNKRSASDGPAHLYKVRADGSNAASPRRLTDGAADQDFPDVSPDGSRLVYSSRSPGEPRPEIHVADVDGSDPVRLDLGSDVHGARYPRFSPSGDEIVFTGDEPNPINSDVDYLGQLWIVSADGSHRRRLTSGQYSFGAGGTFTSQGDIVAHRQKVTVVHFIVGGDVSSYDPPELVRFKPDGSDSTSFLQAAVPKSDWRRGAEEITAHTSGQITDQRAREIAERIYISHGLDKLEHDANQAARDATKRALTRSALQPALGRIVKLVRLGSLPLTVAGFLIGAEDIGCESALIARAVRPYNIRVGQLVRQVGSASIASHPVLTDRARALTQELKTLSENLKRSFGDQKNCKPYYGVAMATAGANQHVLTKSIRLLEAGWF